MTFNALAPDIAPTVRAPREPRPVYRHAETPGYRRNIHAAMRATAEVEGFSPGESFAIATACAVRTIDAAPGYAAEAAARVFSNMLKGNEPLPVIVRPDGSGPSARWAEIEALPRWAGKTYDATRAA